MEKTAATIQERVRFGADGRLSGVLHYPAEGAPKRAVLLCSPHPNFAGDMENNVVLGLAEALSPEAVVLRFDYRGVGESRIELPAGVSVLDYWDDVEESCNYADALADAHDASEELARVARGLPLDAVGYSFGALTATRPGLADPRIDVLIGIAPPFKRIGFEYLAQCPKPCLLLSGQKDFTYDADVAARLLANAGDRLMVEVQPETDHFFRGREPALGARVREFINRNARRIT